MERELVEAGFGEQEAKIYLALLKKGQSVASEISKEAKINRSVSYKLLDGLVEKGIVGYVIKNNVKYFSATDPKNLIKVLKEKQKILESVVPALKAIKKDEEKNIKVEVYQGLKGGVTVLKDIINTGKEYIGIGGEEQFEKIFPFYSAQHMREIKKNNIKERLLLTKGTKVERIGKTSKIRYLPDSFFIPNTSTIVYGNKVGFVIYKKPFYVVLIQSEDLANNYRMFFNALWGIAKHS